VTAAGNDLRGKMRRVMGLRRSGLKASAIGVGVTALSVLPAPAGAYMKACAHVRGYNNTVTVRDMTCHRAARILWQAREGHLNPSGFHCTFKSAYPGGGFPVWITCERGRAAARGSETDGRA
jgi:hypothetical protein